MHEICVNASGWDNRIDMTGGPAAVRLGFRQIDGFREDWADAIARAQPFAGVEDLARRAALPTPALRLLADADALNALGYDRREGLWEVRRTPARSLPLFAYDNAPETGPPNPMRSCRRCRSANRWSPIIRSRACR